MYIVDNKKLESMYIVPPTLNELIKKLKVLEMQKKNGFSNFRYTTAENIFKYGNFILGS